MELTLDQMDKVSGGILVEQSEDYYAQKYCAVGMKNVTELVKAKILVCGSNEKA